MRSHGPSCKRWRCSMRLLFHFPCWTWSITLNGKLAQSSLTSWSPPSLLSFVATFISRIFLSVQIGNCSKQLIQCKVHKIFFPTSLHLPKMHSNWGSYAPISPSLQSTPCWFQHVHLRCLRHSSSRGSSIVSIMDALNRGLDEDPEYSTFLHCKSWTCAQNWWGLATSVLETWRCWWWCSKFWAQFPSSSFEFHVLHG